MKSLTKIVTALALSLSLSFSAMAATEAQNNVISIDQSSPDLSYAFGNNENLQVKSISEQEMDNIQGAAIWFAPAIAVGARYAITGFTRHGLNQTISRGGVGVSNKAILNTMRNPTSITQQTANGTVKFKGKEATVVLNNQGKVVTAYGKPR